MDMGMDFDLSDEVAAPAPPAAPDTSATPPDVSLSMDGIQLDDDDLHALPDFNATAPIPVAAVAQPAPANESGMLEFDMGSLSLDLEPATEKPTEAPDSLTEDPLETKLALADEFVSIGDEDGARALIEEVVAEATGDMRAKAQRALANLS
jgi:pilus assembly protein FimV